MVTVADRVAGVVADLDHVVLVVGDEEADEAVRPDGEVLLHKLPGLYDAVLKVAVLGRSNAGLVSTLTLSGASWENIDRIAGRYLERVAWR